MGEKRRSLPARILKYVTLTLGGILCLIVLALVGVTFWLNPERLTRLVNEKGSEYLKADVRVSNLRFTLWSSFPRLYLVADSISLRSRTLDSLPEATRGLLPEGADVLGGCGRFSGAVNLRSLLKGDIRLHNVEIDDFSLNLVAVNDSIDNYSIFPETDNSKTRIPKMSANLIELRSPKTISYRSLQSGLNGRIQPKVISLKEDSVKGPKKDVYDLVLSGNVNMAVDSLAILTDFPFSLDGKVNLHFDPFGIVCKDYSIGLGNVETQASVNFVAGSSPGIRDLSFQVKSFHLMKLLGYLPPEVLPQISGLDADVMVNASARLTRPYHFSSSSLPSVEVRFSVPDGDVLYTVEGGDRYSVRHIGLNGVFMFNGDDPSSSYISIPGFDVVGEGMDLQLRARVDDMLGSPKVTANVEVASRIENLRRYFAVLEPFRPAGDVSVTTDLSFMLPTYTSTTPEDVSVSGRVTMKDAKFCVPAAGAKAQARDLVLDFNSKMPTLSDTVTSIPADIKGKLGNVVFTIGGKEVTRLSVKDLDFAGSVRSSDGPSGSPDSLSVALKASRFDLRRGGLDFTLRNFMTDMHVAPEDIRIPKPEGFRFADEAMLRQLPHTRELLTFNVSDSLKSMLRSVNFNGRLNLSDGVLHIRDYPAEVRLGRCAVRWSTDSIAIDRFSFSSQQSSLVLSGGVSNLRQYLTWPGQSSLVARLHADIDTLNINQLAKAYEKAVATAGLGMSRADSIAAAKKREETYAHQDTTALILPRNINVSVDMTGREVIYTNLFFSGMKTRLSMADGILRLGDLQMQATFAGAGVNLVYDTSNIENIALYGDVAITDLDLLKMYAKFPSIERNFPEVLNLSGQLSLNADFNLGVYPTMTADVPGFTARVGLNGQQLKLHQTEFIHHIVRMMLIFSHDDIHIADINIAGNVHDNLLELYPFNLDFSRYKLKLEGLNNFNGDLYYHIGVEKSPIPFKFGIEVEGQYHHPKLRFTGVGWDRKKAVGITSHILESGSFNFVHYARKGMKAFVHEAAKSPERDDTTGRK